MDHGLSLRLMGKHSDAHLGGEALVASSNSSSYCLPRRKMLRLPVSEYVFNRELQEHLGCQRGSAYLTSLQNIEALPSDYGMLLAANSGRECCCQHLRQFSYHTEETLQQTS